MTKDYTIGLDIYADLEQQLNENIELKSRIDQLTTKVQEWISEELLEHELDLVCEEMSMVELSHIH